MKLRGSKNIFLFFLLIFLSISVACNFPGVSSDEPAVIETVPLSTQAVDELLENVENAAESVKADQPFQLTITETQLTSLVNFELQARQEDRIKNVQIFLRDGQIRVTGDIEQNSMYFPAEVIVSVTTDGIGNPIYDILSAKIGPFEVPAYLADQLTSFIDQAIYSQLFDSSTQIYIESITIINGEIVISGYKK